VLIRRERPDGVDRIDEVHRHAFAGVAPAGSEPVEVGLVRALRTDRGWVPALSLVAEEDEGHLIGHVIGSEGFVDDTAVIGLGPIGVLPKHQGHHVGHALMHAVLSAADALDYPLVVLLRHTTTTRASASSKHRGSASRRLIRGGESTSRLALSPCTNPSSAAPFVTQHRSKRCSTGE
jgi:predicted N-acetyltransferase YhbS